jgi:hypothetical protein
MVFSLEHDIKVTSFIANSNNNCCSNLKINAHAVLGKFKKQLGCQKKCISYFHII